MSIPFSRAASIRGIAEISSGFKETVLAVDWSGFHIARFTLHANS